MKRTILALSLLAVLAGGSLAQADALGGGKFNSTSVLAHATDRYTVSFRGGELAQVVVRGDGDTDLDLYVYDENGILIASDTDGSDYCVVRWMPRWTGAFSIQVVNRGSVFNRYVITTN